MPAWKQRGSSTAESCNSAHARLKLAPHCFSPALNPTALHNQVPIAGVAVDVPRGGSGSDVGKLNAAQGAWSTVCLLANRRLCVQIAGIFCQTQRHSHHERHGPWLHKSTACFDIHPRSRPPPLAVPAAQASLPRVSLSQPAAAAPLSACPLMSTSTQPAAGRATQPGPDPARSAFGGRLTGR